MFRKIRRVNLRKRNDSEDEERDAEQPFPGIFDQQSELGIGSGEHQTIIPLIGPADPPQYENGPVCQAAKPRKEAKEVNPIVTKASLLSFQDDDEEEEEVFKVKKSNYSKKIVKLLKKEYKEDQEKSKPKSEFLLALDGVNSVNKSSAVKDGNQEDAANNSDLGEEEMEVESEKEDEKPKAGSFTNPLSSLNVLRPGEIPDAAFIHAARKKRQMARELGDFPSHEADGGKSRLVREDENDASDDEDDDEKRRIVFSVREKSQRQKIAEEIGIEGSDDEALATGEQDEEISRWEQEQIRKGISIPQVQAPQPAEANNLFYPTTYQGIPYGSSYAVPYSYTAYGSNETKSQKTDNSVSFKTPSNEMTPVTIDLVKKQLKDRLDAMKETHKANRELYEKHQQSKQDSSNSIIRLEGCAGGNGERYQFLQEMRGYVQDLLECFREKVPLINELESAMTQLYKQRAVRLVQRRQDDIKDESSEFSSHSSKAVMAPNLDSFGRDRALYQEHAKQRRIAEREARRARRRQAREVTGKMSEHLEGLSSDDEETSTDITNFDMEKDRILKESSKVFEDTLENFHSIDCIKDQFETWRTNYYSSYKDAYIGLCLPKLLNPLIRLQMLTWNPLEINCRDFEGMKWFESLVFYGCEEKEYDKEDADVALLPSIVEKIILPRLAVIAENVWDPFSTTQTSRLVAVFQKLINGYPTVVNSENKTTEALLRALLVRMRRTLDDDVFMPLYPKNVIENKNSGPCVFFQRQFWSSIKLLGNFLKWYGILSNKTLQELALDGLLNRYILMAFQNNENGGDTLKKAQSVIACFPKQWFSNLKGGKTIPQLENLVRYLSHLAGVIYRNNIGCSDVEKRNARDQIRQIVKLLASIRALENAASVANDYNAKDVKAPS
ncbi:PAX3- and PAX7-binding protein 1 [Spea bombifrons]|uniref:PAX3- and PAX7-binding protein 1 n=1 Tax=Spea bombifrons TaxID=233779 RepID=UPI00234AABB9|nr:PAX3- and PAX7-binding protein 1 [Spea bombifrons]